MTIFGLIDYQGNTREYWQTVGRDKIGSIPVYIEKQHNSFDFVNEHNLIIESVAKGDKFAFQELYSQFSDKVYNTSLSYAQNEQDAEEITQDVFTSVFRNASHFKGDASLSTWIYRITVNTAINHIKKKKRSSFLRFGDLEPSVPDFDHPGILMENRESASTLFKVIHTLPDSQKTAFILSFVEELPRQEVADIMETSLKAVESLLQRAKKNLRDKLEYLYPNRRK